MNCRHIQKQIPHLLETYAVEESVKDVRANIKREFIKHGTKPLDASITSMLVSKGQVKTIRNCIDKDDWWCDDGDDTYDDGGCYNVTHYTHNTPVLKLVVALPLPFVP